MNKFDEFELDLQYGAISGNDGGEVKPMTAPLPTLAPCVITTVVTIIATCLWC